MHGKLAYLQIPALDIERSAEFYRLVFGWNIRQRSDGAIAFDEPNGAVSGAWVVGRPPSVEAGLRIFICVDNIAITMAAIVLHGGEITEPVGCDAGEISARFRDPGGNIFSIFEDR